MAKKKKKSGKRKLDNMTEEERIIYEEQKRLAEEEMRKKKEDMLSQFLKVTLQNSLCTHHYFHMCVSTYHSLSNQSYDFDALF